MPPTKSPSSLNVREAAAFLGAHIETLRRLARRGAIPSFKVGKDWRFWKEALVKWSEEQGGPDEAAARVVIVDDEENVCRALAEIIRRAGYRPVASTDPQAALGLVAAHDVALVLLDLRMPDMSGPQFLSALRKTHPDLPVVIITGHPDGLLMQEAAQYPPLMLLAKPFTAEQVRQTVHAVLGEKGGRSAARRSG